MNKGKVVRLAGFVGALGLSTVLVTTAVQGTGAYFTDSTDGNFSATSGHLNLLTKTESDSVYKNRDTVGNIGFAGIMPGEKDYRHFTVNYKPEVSSGEVDVWLVFNADSAGYQNFTGGKGSPLSTIDPDSGQPGGGLGRYGYFQVSDASGAIFTSGNLSFPPYTESNNQENSTSTSGSQCHTDFGAGGSSWIATEADPNPPQYCGVPAKIRLATNMNSGDEGTVTLTFGLNGFKNGNGDQDKSHFTDVPFTLVALQQGQTP